MAKKAGISVGRKSRARICPICQREKKVAIGEQLESGTPCGPDECIFRAEILAVLKITEFKHTEDDGNDGMDVNLLLEKIEKSTQNKSSEASTKKTGADKELVTPELQTTEITVPKPSKMFRYLLLFLLVILVWVLISKHDKISSYWRSLLPQSMQAIDTSMPDGTQLSNNQIIPVSSSGENQRDQQSMADTSLHSNSMSEGFDTSMLTGKWKGEFKVNELLLVISRHEGPHIFGYITVNEKEIRNFNGSISKTEGIQRITLTETERDTNHGEFKLNLLIANKILEGEWISFDKMKETRIILRKLH